MVLAIVGTIISVGLRIRSRDSVSTDFARWPRRRWRPLSFSGYCGPEPCKPFPIAPPRSGSLSKTPCTWLSRKCWRCRCRSSRRRSLRSIWGPRRSATRIWLSTLCVFGFPAVGWGHEAVLPAIVSRDHAIAGTMLGSSLAWRIALSIPVYVCLALACYLLKYPPELQWALAINVAADGTELLRRIVQGHDQGTGANGHSVVRALRSAPDRGDLRVAGPVARRTVAGSAPRALRCLRRGAPGNLAHSWSGRCQQRVSPLVGDKDALYSRYAVRGRWSRDGAPTQHRCDFPVEACAFMGWYAVSRRLVGALLLPATTMISALYPTLCRLYAADRGDFNRTANASLRGVTLMAMPVALLCGLYPQVGVALFNEKSFGPAEDNLRVMSFLVAMVYFSMPLSTCIFGSRKAARMECRAVLLPRRESGPPAGAGVSAPDGQRGTGLVRGGSSAGVHDRVRRGAHAGRRLRLEAPSRDRSYHGVGRRHVADGARPEDGDALYCGPFCRSPYMRQCSG